MPFTSQQFFEVFVSYNAAIWPIQIAAYILGLAVVASLELRWPYAHRFILLVLALIWLWNGIGYHLLFFAEINPVAKLFAGVFVVQAILLIGCAFTRPSLTFEVGRDVRSATGLIFILFAMFIYPALGFWKGHGFMSGPMFGVAPCPTTIFTIGLLLLARGRLVAVLAIIPFLWSLVGLAAALQFGMYEDLALLVASIILVVTLAIEAFRGWRDRGLAGATPEPAVR